jgi:hypothetical protein
MKKWRHGTYNRGDRSKESVYKDFTTVRNNVNIYRLNEYYQYLEEQNNKKGAILVMRKNVYLKKFLGAKVGAWRIIGVFESEGVFALFNGVDIMYIKAEQVISYMKALGQNL